MALVSKSFSDIITFSRGSAATRVNSAGRVESVAAGAPRFDYDPVTLAARGILIEEQRTNLLTYSQDFDNAAWAKVNSPTVLQNVATAPDGTVTADSIQAVTSGTFQYISQTASSTPNTTVTASIYVKKELSETVFGGIGLDFQGGTRKIVYVGFNSVTGAANNLVGASLTGALSVINCGNYWKLNVTATDNGGNTSCSFLYYANLSTDNINVAGAAVASSAKVIWGAQLEAGAFATSYIPSTVTFTGRSSTGTFIGSNGLIQTASAGVARYQYNPANLSVPPFLLLEESRTNLYLGSDNFAYTYNKYLSSISTNVAVSPSGATDADKLVEDTNTGPHRVEANFSATSGVGYTFSVFVKAAGRTQFTIFAFPDNGVFANQTSYFDLSAGTVLSGAGASIASVGNGWFRCSMTLTAGATATGYWGFGPAVGGNSSYAGDGTSGLFLWGAQIEAGSYPTSYIPTTTASVTRAADTSTSAQTTRSADVASVNTLSPWYNATEGTLVAEGSALALNTSTDRIIAAVSDNSVSNTFELYKQSVSANARLYMATSGVLQADLTFASVFNAGTNAKLAAAYKANDVAMSANAAAALTDTNATVPVFTTLGIGNRGSSGSLAWAGHIRRITYYPRKFSSAELQAITS